MKKVGGRHRPDWREGYPGDGEQLSPVSLKMSRAALKREGMRVHVSERSRAERVQVLTSRKAQNEPHSLSLLLSVATSQVFHKEQRNLCRKIVVLRVIQWVPKLFLLHETPHRKQTKALHGSLSSLLAPL